MSFEPEDARNLLKRLGPLERDGDDQASFLALREQILAGIRDVGRAEERPSTPFAWDDRKVLIVAIDDYDANIRCYAMPTDAMPDDLWDACCGVSGKTFASAADCSAELWASAMRVLAALGKGDDPTSFYEVAAADYQAHFDDDGAPAADEIDRVWNLLGPYDVGELGGEQTADLDAWFSGVVVFRKAM